MRVAIVGAGLAGLTTAVELADAGWEVEIFESRPFVGGWAVGLMRMGTMLRWGCTSFLVATISCLS